MTQRARHMLGNAATIAEQYRPVRAAARYCFSAAAVAIAFLLKLWLIPLTGTGAPFVLFFAAVLTVSLLAGAGAGIFATLLSLPLGAQIFVVHAGYPLRQAAFQALLFAVDGSVVVYLTVIMRRDREAMRAVNEQLRHANDERQVFVSFLENSSDFIGISDPDGKPIYVNPAGRRMVGLATDFPVETTQIAEYYSRDQRAFATDVIVRSMLEQGRWEGETCFRHWQTDEPIPVSDAHFMIRDAKTARTLGMGTITRDISAARRIAAERETLFERERAARREAETTNERLRESEERFRLTLEEAPIGMALVALDGHFVRVNHVLSEIIGYSREELTARTFQSVTHPADVDKDVALLGQLARGEIPRYQLEKRYIRKDGSPVDVLISVSVLRNRDGAALYYIVRVEDISERKRADEALRLSEAKFSAIVSIAADAIISVDEQQRITVFNEGAERIFGYARSEIIGKQLEMLIPERFRVVHQYHLSQFAAGDVTGRTMAAREDVFGLRKNGEEFPAEASISKVVIDGGVVIFSVVLRDITERKNTEDALRRAVAARDEVLGIVAHDLRNQLASIVMSAQLARLSPQSEQLSKRLDVIAHAAARMTHQIQGLLDVSVIEMGQLTIDRHRVQTARLLREAADMQTPLASSSGINICVDLESDCDDVWGDRDRLHEVFENLIGNAIKFTDTGGRITVGAAARDGDVLFRVADTGRGIPLEQLPHVFDRFWQAVPRARRLGAGLGLAITKGIVEAHGGRIWVDSTPGKGSTFYFTIPTARLSANHEKGQSQCIRGSVPL